MGVGSSIQLYFIQFIFLSDKIYYNSAVGISRTVILYDTLYCIKRFKMWNIFFNSFRLTARKDNRLDCSMGAIKVFRKVELKKHRGNVELQRAYHKME